jgi:hypothetical protein
LNVSDQETAAYLGMPVTDINGYSDLGFMQGQVSTRFLKPRGSIL